MKTFRLSNEKIGNEKIRPRKIRRFPSVEVGASLRMSSVEVSVRVKPPSEREAAAAGAEAAAAGAEDNGAAGAAKVASAVLLTLGEGAASVDMAW